MYQHQALIRVLAYLREGYFPLWSPYLFNGMSAAFEQSLSQILSPLSWVYLFFSGSFNGSLLKIILHYKLFIIGLGGCFAFLFFVQISKAALPSFVGALIFMFNFRMLDNLRYSTPVEILAFLPLLLLFTDHCASPSCPRWVWVGFPVTLGITLLSGHPQHNIYNLFLIAFYFVFKLSLNSQISPRKKGFWQKARKPSGIFFLLNLAGIGIATPLLLPFLWDVMPFLGTRVEESVVWMEMYKLSPFS
ncbi:MAG: hypothetical protein AABZ60_08565, partial [Planctomycetota bacterium]